MLPGDVVQHCMGYQGVVVWVDLHELYAVVRFANTTSRVFVRDLEVIE